MHFNLAAIAFNIMSDVIEIDQVGMVRPEKDIGRQQLFEFFERFAHDYRGMVPEMKGCIIAVGFEVDDVADIKELNT